MLPDGDADFETAMRILVKKHHLGFSKRSWRYSMIVNDGVINTQFVEDVNNTGDPLTESRKPEILDHLIRAAVAE